MMHRKMTVCLLFIFLIIPLLAAATPSFYFRLNDRCNVIDLEPTLANETNKFLTHNLTAQYVDLISSKDSTGIYDTDVYYMGQTLAPIGLIEIPSLKNSVNQLVASLGNAYTLCGASVRVSVTSSDDWWYTLIEDKRYKRHFGLDLFARVTSTSGGKDSSVTGVNGNASNTGVHFGYQKGVKSESGSIEFEIIDSSGNTSYKAAWFDICLVADVNQQTQDLLIPTDSYYVARIDFEISVVVTVEDQEGIKYEYTLSYDNAPMDQKYSVQIMGYYKPGDSAQRDNSALFYLEMENNNIDISEAYGRDPVEIAKYHFTTDSKPATDYKNGAPGYVYIFLSSAENAGSNNSRPFSLDWVDGSANQTNTVTSIQFTTTLKSDTEYGHRYDDDTNNETIPSNGAVSYSNGNYLSGSLVIKPDEFADKGNNYIRWHDEGSIYLTLPKVGNYNSVTDLGLKAGSYQSIIYVHIVTDFNPRD